MAADDNQPHRPVDPRARSPNSSSRCWSAGASATCSPALSPSAREGRAGASTRGRRRRTARPGSHHVLARVFKDIFPRYRTMCGYYVERKGGWDCHGLPVELAVEEELGISRQGRHRALWDRRVQRALPREGAQPRRGLERADRADRLLDRPRATPTARSTRRYVESVWWALQHDPRQGPAVREAQGRPVLPALRHRALQPRARPARRLPRRPRPVGLRALPGSKRSSTAARRRRAARLDDDAVDARLQRRGRGRPGPDVCARAGGPRAAPRRRDPETWLRLAEPLVERVLGPDAEILERFPGSALDGRALRAALSPTSRRWSTGRRGHTVLPADFVTAEDGTGLGAHRDRVRRGRLPPRRAVRADRRQPGAPGRHLRRADRRVRGTLGARTPTPTSSRTCARAAGCCAPSSYEHSYPHCWRCGTPLLYYAKPSLVHRARARSATACWRATRRSTGTRSTSSTGASASGWRATSTGRCRASATGARRCRCGAARSDHVT